MNLTYAKTFGSTTPKLHLTTDGKYTLCGYQCYGKSDQTKPWTDVCQRCTRISESKKS